MSTDAAREDRKGSRIAYVDNLRALMITLVVLTHVAVTYSGLGSWFYKENQNVGMTSMVLFGIYQSFAQAFSMGLLFLLAGYFIPGSLERKGAARFVKDRLFRLGVPTLVFMFILHPLCVAITNPDIEILRYYIHGITSLDFLSWSGPLWFALALLILTLFYVLFRKIFGAVRRESGFAPTVKNALILVLLITAVAFALRTVFPLGTDVVNMQLGYFSSYIIMFVLGIRVYRSGLLDGIDYQVGRKWFLAAFAIGLPLWLLVMILVVPSQVDLINGGIRWQAAAFALWESFFCVAMIIGLMGIFKKRFNAGRPAARFLSEQAFGVYVFHPPVLLAVSTALKGLALQPLLKFAVVAVPAVAGSFAVSYLIRRVGFLHRVFS